MLSPEMIQEVSKLQTYDDCKQAWDLIKLRLAGLTHNQAQKFRVGQSVWFMSKKSNGIRIEGTVIRVNKKSISVDTNTGKWNIAPSLLTPIEVKKTSAS